MTISAIQFLNTRPAEKASVLTNALSAKGIAVKEMPLLAIKPLSLTETEQHYLSAIDKYDMTIFISPTAVQLLLAKQTVDKTSLKNTNCIAVGTSTQHLLAHASVNANIPNIASNEGMLAMPDIQSLSTAHKVLIIRGQGGRRLLYDDLVARGVQVDSVALYARQCPDSLLEDYQQIKTWANIVLITSGESWQHWCRVCDEVSNYNYLVLGERLHKIIKDDLSTFLTGKTLTDFCDSKVSIVHSLQPDVIYNALDFFQ